MNDEYVSLPKHAADEPGIDKVHKYLLFGLSLPERALRSTSALLGGALRESTALLIPQAFKSSKTYGIFVQQMLDFMVNDIGGAEAPDPIAATTSRVENFVARKAVGNFVELAGLATLHLSPLTVLAVLSDVAYGSQTYLKALSAELKERGVIDESSTIDHASDLLDAVSSASGVTASAFDTPPLSVSGLRETINQTRAAVSRIDPTRLAPQSEIQRLWDEMQIIAREEEVSLFDVSANMSMYTINRIGKLGTGALSTVTVAGSMFDQHILDHYSNSLSEIHRKGYYQSLRDTSKPYFTAVWNNFSTEKTTVTEEVLSGRLFEKALAGMRDWIHGPETTVAADATAADSATSGVSPDATEPEVEDLDRPADAGA